MFKYLKDTIILCYYTNDKLYNLKLPKKIILWYQLLQILGKYKRFWGSDQWSIKMDFLFEKKKKSIKFSNLLVEFKNDKTGLFNSFEVNDLCSCVSLMMKFAEGFGIAIFDRRLVNWMADYFDEHGVEISSNSILNCLKKELDEKIDVKVKKLTIIDKTFTEILEYNPDDLLIDFNQYFDQEDWVQGYKELLTNPISSTISYELNGSKKTDQNITIIKNNYNGLIDVDIKLDSKKEEVLNNIIIVDLISPEFKPQKVIASLIAPDKTVMGVFQPLELFNDENGLSVTWKIDELKINHTIRIEYILKQRIPFNLTLSTDEGDQKFLRYFDIESKENNKYEVNIPAFIENSKFTLSRISSLTALIPIELETQTTIYLYPHYILKIIDLGTFQKVTFSEPFIESLTYDAVKLEGSILPVLTFYESFIPQIGAKLIKKIFRNNSYTNPIIMYNLETSSYETIELVEEFPESVIINLFTLGDQDIHEQLKESNNKKELILKLNATNDTVLFSLNQTESFDLEKSLISVRNTNNYENFDLFQSLNIESIVDQTNKNYLDFKKFKIHSETKNDKIRLRAFTLKILEKEKELDSQVSSSELDKAFETLKQTESLELLKEKIKSGYQTAFTSPETSESNITSPNVSEPVSSQAVASSPKPNESEINELDAFIRDFGGNEESNDDNLTENEFESVLDEQTSKANEEYLTTLANSLDENSENFVSTPESDTLTETTSESDSISNLTRASEYRQSAIKNELQSEMDNSSVSIQEITAKDQEIETRAQYKSEIEKKGPDEAKPQTDGSVDDMFPSIPSVYDNKSEFAKQDDKYIEFIVLFDTYPDNNLIAPEIVNSDSKVIYFDQDQKEIDPTTYTKQPNKIYSKLPKDDRFLILVLNPDEFLSAHIYGRWKNRKMLNYKVLLSEKIGLWQIRIQFLETGLTFDYKFRME